MLKSEGPGVPMGLGVHVLTDEDSYMYPLISSTGTNVRLLFQIFILFFFI